MSNTTEQPKPNYNTILLAGILVLIIILMAGLGFWFFTKSRTMQNSLSDSYQAVFLDNGQVYFGKLENERGSAFLALTDVYYLKVTKSLQPNGEGEQVEMPDINLIKLGTELHGPTDRLQILQEHILFIEDLKPDSKIVDAIKQYKNK